MLKINCLCRTKTLPISCGNFKWILNTLPVRAKALKIQAIYKAFALTGALLIAIIPRAMPWARSFWAFSPFLNHLRNFSYLGKTSYTVKTRVGGKPEKQDKFSGFSANYSP